MKVRLKMFERFMVRRLDIQEGVGGMRLEKKKSADACERGGACCQQRCGVPH